MKDITRYAKKMKVVNMVANGNSSHAIEKETGINCRTVEAILASLRRQYACKSTTHLIYKLVCIGAIPIDTPNVLTPAAVTVNDNSIISIISRLQVLEQRLAATA